MASVGIPKYALVPLFILWFGIDDAPKLVLVGLLVFYPVFIAVFAGIRNVDRRLIDMARVLGASEAAIAREVIWNSLMPFFFAALKIALPRAISAAIIGEFLVGNEGLGYLIEHSRQNFDTVGVFAGIVVATALVLVINAVLTAVDRRSMPGGRSIARWSFEHAGSVQRRDRLRPASRAAADLGAAALSRPTYWRDQFANRHIDKYELQSDQLSRRIRR